MMQTSEQLSELAKALAKAQSKIKNAIKDSTNPHFKSKYADLASVWEAVREPLTSNGLSIVQTFSNIENKISCTTMLLHESGQFIKDTMTMTPQQNTPQAQGSCATYLRRYMLQAIAGVAPDDDDGNAATGNGVPNGKPTTSEIKTTLVQNTVAQKPVETKSSATTVGVETFSTQNQIHIKQLSYYLQMKNQMQLFDALGKRLIGKPFTKATLDAEFDIINPEKPDKEPE